MRALIDAGRLYIAQPPLYKLTTKKGQRYVTTDAELRQILIDRGVGSLTVEQPKDGKSWSGPALRELSDDLRKLEDLVPEIAPAWARVPLDHLLERYDGAHVPMHWAHAEGKDHFFDTLPELQAFLELQKLRVRPGEPLRVYDGPDREFPREAAHVVACHLAHTEELALALASLERRGLAVRGGTTWSVVGGKEDQTCRNPLQLAAALRKGAQSEVDVQRYKGLGEMDADQLWESTMDPARRTLYQVTMLDAISADEIFTVLMSEGVEARREYIERHALEITNLDV
jgi:DNA gyrase subunit B